MMGPRSGRDFDDLANDFRETSVKFRGRRDTVVLCSSGSSRRDHHTLRDGLMYPAMTTDHGAFGSWIVQFAPYTLMCIYCGLYFARPYDPRNLPTTDGGRRDELALCEREQRRDR